MSSVWATRYRLLLERLDAFAAQLEPAAVDEQTVRLLMGVLSLLHQHAVNARGRCRFCGWTRWGWRLWHPRPRCTVYRALDVALAQPMEVVWWQLLTDTGHDVALVDVRQWLSQHQQTAHLAPDNNETENDDNVVPKRITG